MTAVDDLVAPMLIDAVAGQLLALQIGAGSLAIAAGWVAMLSLRGGRTHRVAVDVFFGSVLAMTGVGATVALVAPVMPWRAAAAALFALALASTAWALVRREEAEIGRFEAGAFLAAVGVALMEAA